MIYSYDSKYEANKKHLRIYFFSQLNVRALLSICGWGVWFRGRGLCVCVGGVSAKLWVRLIHYRSLGKDGARFPCGGEI